MTLLNSFMVDRKSKSALSTRFAEGQLTIIDLSDPFIDPPSACSLFEVITRLFIRTEVPTGKVLVVDEAHKVNLLVSFGLAELIGIITVSLPWHQFVKPY